MCGIFALIGNPTGLNDVDYKNIEKHIKHHGTVGHTGFIKEQLFSAFIPGYQLMVLVMVSAKS